MGDFVKGNDLSWLPESLQQGVWLHRRIDSFTDSHQQVKALKQAFPKTIRRMSGICIDIWFDHLLLSYNHEFLPTLEGQVFGEFYQELAAFDANSNLSHSLAMESLPFNVGYFQRVQKDLLKRQWLASYRETDACLNAFKSVEARLNYRLQFAIQAFDFITQNQSLFEQVFKEFYPELVEYSLGLSDP